MLSGTTPYSSVLLVDSASSEVIAGLGSAPDLSGTPAVTMYELIELVSGDNPNVEVLADATTSR